MASCWHKLSVYSWYVAESCATAWTGLLCTDACHVHTIGQPPGHAPLRERMSSVCGYVIIILHGDVAIPFVVGHEPGGLVGTI